MKIDFEKHRDKIEKTLSILGAFIYVVFASTFVGDIFHHHRISSVFPLIMTSLFVYFFLVRDRAQHLNLSPYDWLISLYGTFTPLFLRPAPVVHDALVLIIIQSIGVCISVTGLLSLNKSIGLAPANRGVKTFWAYKFVRHPIYAGYFILYFSYCAQNFTLRNVLIIALTLTCEILRLFAEEKYLSADPAYAAYMKKTRWRLIPYLF